MIQYKSDMLTWCTVSLGCVELTVEVESKPSHQTGYVTYITPAATRISKPVHHTLHHVESVSAGAQKGERIFE
jgi:hypothetical protein